LFDAQLAYSVYVGGDAWEYWGGSNRYVCIAMPGFFVALSCSLWIIAEAITIRMNVRAPASGSRLTMATFVFLTAVAIVSANSLHGVRTWAEVLLVHAPLHSGTGDENQHDVELALALRAVTMDDATITVTRAGTIPYFADRPSIDLLGKTDRHLAREAARVPAGRARFTQFRPGHSKFDYRYSIEQQMPDVVVQLWDHRDEIRPYLRRFYTGLTVSNTCIYARETSPRVRWERVSRERCGETAP
jgi:hypothetical protein